MSLRGEGLEGVPPPQPTRSCEVSWDPPVCTKGCGFPLRRLRGPPEERGGAELRPAGGAGLGAEAADAARRSLAAGPSPSDTPRPGPRGSLRSPSVGAVPAHPLFPLFPPGPAAGPSTRRALWPRASQACRAARRHGAQARRTGALSRRLPRRGGGGRGFSAAPGRGPGRARAPRSQRGCRVAGGGKRGEDGRPHPEAVLSHPGEAAHQLHPAGLGEVMRRQARPRFPARPPAPSPARLGRPATPAPRGAFARAPSLGGRRGRLHRLCPADAGPGSLALQRWAALPLRTGRQTSGAAPPRQALAERVGGARLAELD